MHSRSASTHRTPRRSSRQLSALPRHSAVSTWRTSPHRAVFEIEERLKKRLNIPVFHDDQHGTAIVVLAGIINALKVTGKKKEDCRVVVNGAGSAGVAITKLLLNYGFPHITMCDKTGMLCKGAWKGLTGCRKRWSKLPT